MTARFVYLKDVPSETPLGYAEAFHTRCPSRIATVSVSYADGLNRALSNRGHAIVRGRLARLVGSISIDLSGKDGVLIAQATNSVPRHRASQGADMNTSAIGVHSQGLPAVPKCGMELGSRNLSRYLQGKV